MIDFAQARLEKFAAAWVGNKSRYEWVSIPSDPMTNTSDIAEELLVTTFFKPFAKTQEYFYIQPHEEGGYGPVQASLKNIFDNPDSLGTEMKNLSNMLYEHCNAPKIHGGEFFAAYFDDLIVDGEPTSAIGIWKVETKNAFFSTNRTQERFLLNTTEGITTGKPQVAAIIFNLDETEGYRVVATDVVSKKTERSFWKDDFLSLRPIEDDYFNTRHTTAMTAEFLKQKLPFKLGLDRAQTAVYLDKAGNYFKDFDEYDLKDFCNRVFENDTECEMYSEFRKEYCLAYALPLPEQFPLNTTAVKKDAGLFKTLLKLDKNFKIDITGRPDLIERGYDEVSGKKFYKVFFENED